MATAVSPTQTEPKYHVSLSDGTTTVGMILYSQTNDGPRPDYRAITRNPLARTAIKTSVGDNQYSDFELPYTSIPQDDWSGGRGSETFEDNTSRYYDGYNINTTKDGMILGPRETYSTGYRKQIVELPGNVTWTTLSDTTKYLARTFTTTSTSDMDAAELWIARVGTPTGTLTVELCANNAGNPGTVLQTATVTTATITDYISVLYKFDWTGTQGLENATVYWIKIYDAGTPDASNYWQVLCNRDTATVTKKSADGTSWSAATRELYFRLKDADATAKAYFFNYKGAQMAAMAYDDGSASKLYINGWQGVASAGAATTITDDDAAFTADEWIGSVVVLTSGTGSDAPKNWRVITDNDATSLTVSPAWDTNPAANTEYVIVAANKWTEISTTGLATRVTDVLSHNGIIYMAQGDATNIRRLRRYNNAGTWTNTFADDSTNKATFLEQSNEGGTDYVWSATATPPAAVQKASAVYETSISDLSFGSALYVGDRTERITNLIRYDDPERLWTLKEGSFYKVDNDIPYGIPLQEMRALQDGNNGRAACVSDVYLVFSFGQKGGVMRYSRNVLDSVGLDKDAGLPSNLQGPVSAMVAYPGGDIFAAVDGGSSNFSGIYQYSGGGWHPLYRAPRVGERIRSLHIQVIPGDTIDRLWFSQGADLCWLPVSLNPYLDSNYTYTHEGWLETGWYYAHLKNVRKLWKSLQLFMENVSSSYYAKADYKKDNDSSWTAISGTYDTDPLEELNLSSSTPPDVRGRRIKFRIRLYSLVSSGTPRVRTSLVESFAIIPVKFNYTWLTKLTEKDFSVDLAGEDDLTLGQYSNVETAQAALDSWAANVTPLTMRTVFSPYDNKTVVMDAIPMRPTKLDPEEQVEEHVIQVSVNET